MSGRRAKHKLHISNGREDLHGAAFNNGAKTTAMTHRSHVFSGPAQWEKNQSKRPETAWESCKFITSAYLKRLRHTLSLKCDRYIWIESSFSFCVWKMTVRRTLLSLSLVKFFFFLRFLIQINIVYTDGGAREYMLQHLLQ